VVVALLVQQALVLILVLVDQVVADLLIITKLLETQVQIATLIDKDTLVVLEPMVLDLKTLVAVAVALAVLEKLV
tara:strand:+ start:48 stop:272 length:225 start_codon:yes stop_codon:yes gene_type:complete